MLSRAAKGACILALVLAAGIPGVAQDAAAAPDAIKVGAAETLVQRVHASGDQIYTCDGSQWVLTGPDARLTGEGGHVVGSHFAGPTWRWVDGSSVTGRPVASASPDSNSIPWLLVRVTANKGRGVLENVTYVQRLHTRGGKPPASCTASQKGRTLRVPYTADYYFFAARR